MVWTILGINLPWLQRQIDSSRATFRFPRQEQWAEQRPKACLKTPICYPCRNTWILALSRSQPSQKYSVKKRLVLGWRPPKKPYTYHPCNDRKVLALRYHIESLHKRHHEEWQERDRIKKSSGRDTRWKDFRKDIHLPALQWQIGTSLTAFTAFWRRPCEE